MYKCRSPKNQTEFDAYYQLRWQMLRSPWRQPYGSEKDDVETQAYHRIVLDKLNNIVGVGRLQQINQNTAQIRYMAVTDKAQGKGVGTYLLTELERIAIEVGVTEITLNAREQALTFYTNTGYQEQGFSHTLYDAVHHFNMSKKLVNNTKHLREKAQELQNIWHQTIPLSKAMNINICYFDQEKLITNCYLLFNKNLHNTMFAGSIYTLATLTGWAWVYFALQQYSQQADIVLAEGNIRYLAPLSGVAHAKTSIDLVNGNGDALANGKNARYTVKVEVCCGDKVAAVFTGSYAAVLKSK